jgi:hypothetical protein
LNEANPVLVAVILYFWHELRPVLLDDADDKRPLKLQ